MIESRQYILKGVSYEHLIYTPRQRKLQIRDHVPLNKTGCMTGSRW